MSVRIGVIGVGVMGAEHARILASQVPGASIEMLHDADPARGRKIAEETGAHRLAADPLTLIRDPAVDAVLIASPDNTHKELALDCIAARKPVLCEKPLAPTTADCLEVIAAEEALGSRLVQVGHMRRFDPAYVEMKTRLTSGLLGDALILNCVHRNVSAPSWFNSDMAINNSAVHDFDIARWILNVELTSVEVFRPKAASASSTDIPVFMVLEAASGQLVNVEIFNNARYGYDVRGELVCERGTIALRTPGHLEMSADRLQGTDLPADWRPRFADAYRLQAQGWIRSITSGQLVGASLWDGYAAAAIAEAGIHSLREQRRVSIGLAAKPTLYG